VFLVSFTPTPFYQAWTGNNCVPCNAPSAGLIVLFFVLTISFVGYIYISVGSATVTKVAILLNYLQLLAQSYVVQSVKFLPMVEFAYASVVALANICLYPFNWWQLWVWTMMTPWINLTFVALFFGARMLYKRLHRHFAHAHRKCNDRPGRSTVGVNSIQAGIQLIFFNNLSIAKSCLIMFACVSIFDVSVTSTNYSFSCGTSMHIGFIAMSVVWLSLFCIAVPVVVLLAIVAPQLFPARMQRLLHVEFLTTDFEVLR
jgi:hypothetical protein